VAWALQEASSFTESETHMPESLAVRTLQLTPSGKAGPSPAGVAEESAVADFRALLDEQLGVALPSPAAPAALPADETAGQPGSEQSAAEAAGVPAGSLDAAALLAMQMAPAPRSNERATVLSDPGSDTAARHRVEGTGEAVALTAVVAAEEGAATPAIPAAQDDGSRLLAELDVGTEPLRTPAEAGPRADVALAHGMERRPQASAQHPPTPASPLDEPVSIARRSFASDLGDRVLWMASNNRQVAELRVDPPQLGPVEVRLSISGEQASVTLVAAHAGVREALQASIPRLQDMIQSIGLELGNVTVGSDASPRQQERRDEGSGRHGAGAAPDTPGVPDPRAWVPARTGIGLVDTYA